ncbi:hypothetical protein Tco_1214666 [Tanacetum coccineum]
MLRSYTLLRCCIMQSVRMLDIILGTWETLGWNTRDLEAIWKRSEGKRHISASPKCPRDDVTAFCDAVNMRRWRNPKIKDCEGTVILMTMETASVASHAQAIMINSCMFLATSESRGDGRIWKEIKKTIHTDADKLFNKIKEAYVVLSVFNKPGKRVKAVGLKSVGIKSARKTREISAANEGHNTLPEGAKGDSTKITTLDIVEEQQVTQNWPFRVVLGLQFALTNETEYAIPGAVNRDNTLNRGAKTELALPHDAFKTVKGKRGKRRDGFGNGNDISCLFLEWVNSESHSLFDASSYFLAPWKRISDKRTKNKAKYDKTEHGMEKRKKTNSKRSQKSKSQNKSQPKGQLRKVKVKVPSSTLAILRHPIGLRKNTRIKGQDDFAWAQRIKDGCD